MKITDDLELSPRLLQGDGVSGVTKQVLIGPEQGSGNIALRRFIVAPGGYTPWHSHPFEHVVRVEAGAGEVRDESGQWHPLAAGKSVFVPADEQHQFRNAGARPFVFLCIVKGDYA